ncbi:MAG: ATP-binding protein [Cytophagales bacterium]|nr:ATP-binding protein [Cytophagales bacterium]
MNTETNEKKRIVELIDEAFRIRSFDVQSSIKTTKEALNLSKKIKANHLVADCQCRLGYYHMIITEYDKAKRFTNKALKYYQNSENFEGIAKSKLTLASILYKTDKFHDGFLLLLECNRLFRQNSDQEYEAISLKALGTIFEFFGDTKNAIAYYKKSISVSKSIKRPELRSNALNPLSGIYLNQGKIEKATKIINESILLKKKSNDIRGLGFALYGKGKIDIRTKNYDQAQNHLMKALEINKTYCDRVGESMCYNKLGELFIKKSEFKKARQYLLNSVGISEKYNIRLSKFKAYRSLYEIEKQENQFEHALKYLEKYSFSRDPLLKTRTVDLVNSYKNVASLEKMEKEVMIKQQKFEIIKEKNEELDSFFYMVSHDLKGPLNSLIGLNNIFPKDVTDAVGLRYLKKYKEQIEKINKIVSELINLTIVSKNKSDKNLIQFERIIEDCKTSFRHLENYCKITFRTSIDKNLAFFSEWAMVNTIISNLLENSIKYVDCKKPEPEISISIKEENGKILIKVKDNGIGIEEKYIKRVFDMFYRANDEVEGTGLGLYILRKAVHRLNGKIHLKSKINLGTEVTITLPN